MKIKFHTIGCKVNQYETQALKEQFLSLGYEVTNRVADMYIINSCSVTQRADAKSRQALTKAKKENSKAKVVVCGCAANGRKEYWGKLGADIIIPQERKHNLVDIVVNQGLAQKDIWSLRLTKFSNHRAFVKIQDGCDNFCSYCKIPYLRGSSRSRPKKDIIEEVARLVKDHNEIILCGVNIALYGKDLSKNEDLVSLVQSLISIKDLRRLRFSSLESCFLDKRFFSLFKNPKICSHVHLPFQSGDDRVLKEMDKKETTQDYKTMIEGIRRINPDVALSCDVIVGFPSEDDHLFNNTVKFLKEVKPMRIHIFTFSPRENTKFKDLKIRNSKIVRERYQILQELNNQLSVQYRRKFIGKTLDMIAEQLKGEKTTGHTQNYIPATVNKRLKLGEVFKIRIERIDKEDTIASLV